MKEVHEVPGSRRPVAGNESLEGRVLRRAPSLRALESMKESPMIALSFFPGLGLLTLGGRFGYFLFFFCSGRGEGRSPRPPGGGGGRFSIEIPRRGGGFSRRGPNGRKAVCGELGIWGGGG